MMVAGAEPQRRQQQHLLRQPPLDAVGHAGDEHGVGEDGQVMAVLLAGRDRRQHQRRCRAAPVAVPGNVISANFMDRSESRRSGEITREAIIP